MDIKNTLNLKKLVNLSMPSNDVYAYLIGDFPGFLIAYLILKFTSISANAITYCSLILGVFSSILIFVGKLKWGIGFYYLAFVLDFVDGKIARFRHTASPSGKILDLVVDRIVFVSMMIAYNVFLVTAGYNFGCYLLFLINCGLFLVQDSFTMVSVIGKYYSGLPLQKSQYRGELMLTDKFTKLKNFIPRGVTIVFLILVASPLVNFHSYFLMGVIMIQLTHFFKDIFRYYYKGIV